MTAPEKIDPLMLAERIATRLLTVGGPEGKECHRLQLMLRTDARHDSPEVNMGGWSKSALVSQIVKILTDQSTTPVDPLASHPELPLS